MMAIACRYRQSQEVEIFDSVRITTICHFQSRVTVPDKACLLQINLRKDLNTLVKWACFLLAKPTSGALPYLLVLFSHCNEVSCLCQLLYIIIIVTIGTLPPRPKLVGRNIRLDYKKYVN